MVHERKINMLVFIKMKSVGSAKDTVKRMRRQAPDWEKIVAKHISDEGLVFKIYKELLKHNSKKTNNLIKK